MLQGAELKRIIEKVSLGQINPHRAMELIEDEAGSIPVQIPDSGLDLQGVRKVCEDHIRDWFERGNADDSDESGIYAAVLGSLYGPDIFKWIQEQRARRSAYYTQNSQ